MRTKGAEQAIRALAHPVAYRIVATLGMHGAQTTNQLARRLDDVAQSSLYRQLTRLRTAGVVSVAAERKARGATERTYQLASRDAAAFNPADFTARSITAVRSALLNFLAGMVAETSAYFATRAFARDPSSAGAGLVIARLTDDDYHAALREIGNVISRAKKRSEGNAIATRHYFYIVALPEASAG